MSRPRQTVVDEIRAAEFQLRNPLHLPGLTIPVDSDLGAALADWLDAEATRLTTTAHPDWHETVAPHAIRIARLINQ
ncbi:hypothetical protein QMK19_03355 [Streptomyces sp. H10-C2]|uniref:hypothetical protein n=1 Tax=unclassified Streptomyces TaxID=2593676 RepID=UPI0024B942BD|nr:MULTISPECIES: hypothetical protein [unclassified Streptomyces]MDJ0342223.1 hypothetical protein [Streptomyces sp. PH10-H1]MDJ0368737.1 hypothetical protein [Streptomyces sp. H10-C2]